MVLRAYALLHRLLSGQNAQAQPKGTNPKCKVYMKL
jgi:hypothetical protein